jgi:hypothetical protein
MNSFTLSSLNGGNRIPGILGADLEKIEKLMPSRAIET